MGRFLKWQSRVPSKVLKGAILFWELKHGDPNLENYPSGSVWVSAELPRRTLSLCFGFRV